MSHELKLFFDVCCSPLLPRELLAFYSPDYPGLQVMHLLDKFRQSSADSRWLASLQKDKSWIVITCDQGRDKKKEKLPEICKRLGITHVAFSSELIRKGVTEQKNALVAVWTEILLLSRLPPGTQVKLCSHQIRGGINKYGLRVRGVSISTLLSA